MNFGCKDNPGKFLLHRLCSLEKKLIELHGDEYDVYSTCSANGKNSIATGLNTVAASDYSHAEGFDTKITGMSSYVIKASSVANISVKYPLL